MTQPSSNPIAASPAAAAGPRPVPPVVKLLVAIGLTFGVYQLVMFGVRRFVDHKIESAVGGELIDFDVVDLAGKPWRSKELRGRWIVLHFFRSQCHSCLAERGAVKAFEGKIDPTKVTLLGVLLDRVQGYPEEMTRKTLEIVDYHHPILVANAAFVDAFHGAGWAHVTPVTYFIDPSGRIAHSLRGAQTLDSLLAPLPGDARR